MASRKSKHEWQSKIHPGFVELATIIKEFEHRHRQFERTLKVASQPADRQKLAEEESVKLLRWVEEELTKVSQRFPDLPRLQRAYSYLDPLPGEVVDRRDFQDLHWLRHSESLHKTLQHEASGQFSAFQKIVRSQEDAWRITRGQGPLKAFKVDVVHRQFLELVLCLEMEPLTPEELADCADAYCGCHRNKGHDVDALRKQYVRLRKDLDSWPRRDQVK